MSDTNTSEANVRCVMAMTADGKIASRDREAARFGGPADQRLVREQVAWADALLMAAGTLRAYGGTFEVCRPELMEMRRSTGQASQPTSVIVSESLDLPLDLHFFTEQQIPRIITTTERQYDAARDRFAGVADVVARGSSAVDIAAVVDELRARGMRRILLLGGGELNYACFRARIVDELYVTVSPLLYGGRNAPTLLGGDGFVAKDAVRLSLSEHEIIDGEVFLRYQVEY
ncbi:MAG TPA: riboflavin deaminase [Firmicutes bacterium]|nr:riboflavin deaminase [Bacillota bacterium]